MEFEEKRRLFANLLCQRKKNIVSILVQYETAAMVEDEFKRCFDLLANLEEQEEYLTHKYKKVLASFLPLNQPLYSLMLQVFIPSLIMERVYYRPPALLKESHIALRNELQSVLFNAELCAVSRKRFISNFVDKSDIVNFTGKYENVIDLVNKLPSNIAVIYNGSAINPIVVGADADIDLAVEDTINVRLYNSGQDCMAPACIFLDYRITPIFLEALNTKLTNVIVGSNENPLSVVGPMIEDSSIEHFRCIKETYASNILWGGNFDRNKKFIYPTVFYFDHVTLEGQNVYYAPYFWIMSYKSIEDIQKYLNSKYCEQHSGYISLYGKSVQKKDWHSGKNVLIQLENSTLFSEENGNKEFGGYGIGCGFLYKNGCFFSRPILLSREINRIMESCDGCL